MKNVPLISLKRCDSRRIRPRLAVLHIGRPRPKPSSDNRIQQKSLVKQKLEQSAVLTLTECEDGRDVFLDS
jgi:hypothetical protein